MWLYSRFLAMVIGLADRINIAVAAPILMKERGWDTVQMGWVLSGFFIGYSLLMVPVGAVADRYSPKWVLGLSVAWWSLFTAFTPLPQSSDRNGDCANFGGFGPERRHSLHQQYSGALVSAP